MLGKAPILPVPFLGDACRFGGGDSITSGMRGVTGNMSGSGCMTGGASGRASRDVVGISGCSVSCNCGFACLNHLNLTFCPGPSCINSFSWPAIFRVFFLKVGKHMLRTICGPKRQNFLILFVDQLH